MKVFSTTSNYPQPHMVVETANGGLGEAVLPEIARVDTWQGALAESAATPRNGRRAADQWEGPQFIHQSEYHADD